MKWGTSIEDMCIRDDIFWFFSLAIQDLIRFLNLSLIKKLKLRTQQCSRHETSVAEMIVSIHSSQGQKFQSRENYAYQVRSFEAGWWAVSILFSLIIDHHKMQACMRAQSLSCVWLFVTPWTVAHQDPLSTGFSRQGYWSALPFSHPGDLPIQGSNLHLLHWQVDSLPLRHLALKHADLMIRNFWIRTPKKLY